MSAENDQEMDSWIQEIQALKNSETNEPELFLQIVRLAMPKRKEVDYSSEPLDVLEEFLVSLDDTMKADINNFVDICFRESNSILDELAKREISEVEQKYKKERDEVSQELKRRGN